MVTSVYTLAEQLSAINRLSTSSGPTTF